VLQPAGHCPWLCHIEHVNDVTEAGLQRSTQEKKVDGGSEKAQLATTGLSSCD